MGDHFGPNRSGKMIMSSDDFNVATTHLMRSRQNFKYGLSDENLALLVSFAAPPVTPSLASDTPSWNTCTLVTINAAHHLVLFVTSVRIAHFSHC